MGVVDRSFAQQMEIEEKAVALLARGLANYGYQCGILWAGSLAAGAQAYKMYGSGPKAEVAAILASQRIVESFRNRNKYVDCSDITEMEWKPQSKQQAVTQILRFFIKGGPIGCFRMAAVYAPVALDTISSSISEKDFEVTKIPVSCTAELARKMGASGLHTVMVSGFAGGIGLCGDACGALATALWLNGVKQLEKGNTRIDHKDPQALALVDRFLKTTNYEFECKKIVGREFENIAEHAAYLRDGGCTEMIEMLASEPIS